MCHRSGDFDERFHSPKRLCECEYFCCLGNFDRRRTPAFHDERDHPAAIPHLLLSDLVLRMRGMEWIDKFSHLGVFFKELYNRHGILRMPIHTDRESLDTAQKQK